MGPREKIAWMDEKELMPYKVGALMYVPALNGGVGEKVCKGEFDGLDSLALCLEDSVTDAGVREAEARLVKTLTYIKSRKTKGMPFLFVRARNSHSLTELASLLGGLIDQLTGFIFPKFDLSNALEYCSFIEKINEGRGKPLYMMPILESACVMDKRFRTQSLADIREMLDAHGRYVLNIRVGAMDFCGLYGLRCDADQTIYDIGVVRDTLTDILAFFADGYVVSAPVREYFRGSNDDGGDWHKGLENELRLDKANGFVGKTVVHPSQLPFVRKWLRQTQADVDDAKAILNWKDDYLGVARSVSGNRMNELLTHRKWARKVLILSKIYGVRTLEPVYETVPIALNAESLRQGGAPRPWEQLPMSDFTLKSYKRTVKERY